MILTTILIMLIGIWLPYSPLAKLFNFVPLPGIYWIWISGFLLVYATTTHFVKVWFFKRFGDT
jgi:Mg2+-importing ATPase